MYIEEVFTAGDVELAVEFVVELVVELVDGGIGLGGFGEIEPNHTSAIVA
jgi:hypothetical protein